MTSQRFRLPAHQAPAPLIDRGTAVGFRFDGRDLAGCAGDTLASALLANGVHLVGRSFKYHRPRGILAAGAEEPNALVRLRSGARAVPNTRATVVELFDGLVAESQNRWPSLAFDVRAVNQWFSRLIPAGFYYKTFMWPASPRGWLRYEHHIRRAAGLGLTSEEPDPDRYERMHAHCDVLVIGAGPAGLAAALAATRSGARTILVDEHAHPGETLAGDPAAIDGEPATQWAKRVAAELGAAARCTVLARTTAFGHYDQNLVGLVERVSDHLPEPGGRARERAWKIRARRVVLATGAHERPLVFANNDRPGVMLASAARQYALGFGVAVGERVAVFANNDAACQAAVDLAASGVRIACLVDTRASCDAGVGRSLVAAGIERLGASFVARVDGGRRVEAIQVSGPDGRLSGARRIDCDALLMSGGYSPAIHLWSHAQGTLRYDESRAAFLPDRPGQAMRAAGAVNGHADLGGCLADGWAAGTDAAGITGHPGDTGAAPRADRRCPSGIEPCWAVPAPQPTGKRFVDFQNDVTAEDLALAHRENYSSVEHLKRYTTLGMATDQGKTSNVNGIALLAAARNLPIAAVGTTTFRPPYTPVTLGAIVGPERGEHVEPIRVTPMHAWHVAHGAVFVNAGLWRRAQYYPRPGETDLESISREAVNVRARSGLVDVSTLGKIEVGGRDAATFLDRMYANRIGNLAVGRCRYTLMLREDGFVFDDGTVARLGDTHYLLTTTTANAVRVMSHLEYYAQVVWPELQVTMTSVTEQWAAAAIAGPTSRAVLARVASVDVGNAAFPFLGAVQCKVAGIPARLFRMSYSGELAWEIHVPSDNGIAMWEAVLAAGAGDGLEAYGTEAMGVLRIEKGHVVIGPEADGRTTANDLGMGRLVSREKDSVGRRMAARPALNAPERWQLVGLESLEADRGIPRGAKLVTDPNAPTPVPMLGHVTSWCMSPHLGKAIALALLERGRERHGESLFACSPLAGHSIRVRVCDPCFIDPQGERLRG